MLIYAIANAAGRLFRLYESFYCMHARIYLKRPLRSKVADKNQNSLCDLRPLQTVSLYLDSNPNLRIRDF